MAYVSESMHRQPYDVFFVPARGGLGENVVYQANTIAASMAQQTDGDYTTLYVPDNVSETTYNTLMLEPSVIHTLEKIKDNHLVKLLKNFNITMPREKHLDIISMNKDKSFTK
ncbi:Central glycolytic genes regulator [Mycobacteroides abscessus subsp. massiliense]|nr:Central glycolytic genes regulator [Mycobacteroides abscessus subsp. massiliense]